MASFKHFEYLEYFHVRCYVQMVYCEVFAKAVM
jgi:hypothetical protein